MRWTKRVPTSPGWWWCFGYNCLDGTSVPALKRAVKVFRDLDSGLSVALDVAVLPVEDDYFLAWSDAPIPEPEGEVSA